MTERLIDNDDDSNDENPQRQPDKKVFKDVEDCIQRAGGVSRFQYFSFTLIVFGMVCGAFILYCISYFTKVPPLLCQATEGAEWKDCKPKVACDDKKTYKYKPDPDAIDTLTNWVSQIDLYCTEDFEMSLIGSMFFLGTFLGSFILPRAADVYGRKPLFLIGLALYIGVAIALIFVENLYTLYVLMFLGGISETGRYYVAYVYIVEMMPAKVQDAFGIYIFFVFAFAMTWIALQFWFITKDVFVNNYIALAMAGFSWITVIFFVPESPRFLFSTKQYEKAR